MNFTFDWNNPLSMLFGGLSAGLILSLLVDLIYWKRKYGQSGLGAKIQALRERAASANAMHDRIAVLERENAGLLIKMENAATGESGALVQEYKQRAEQAERELVNAKRDLSAVGSGANTQTESLRQRAEVAERALAESQARIARYGEMAAEMALVKNQLAERTKELEQLKSQPSEGSGADHERLLTRAEEAERYVQVLKLEMSQMAPQNEVKFWHDKADELEATLKELRQTGGDPEFVENLKSRNQLAQEEIERLRHELAQISDSQPAASDDAVVKLKEENEELRSSLASTRKEAETILEQMQSRLDSIATSQDTNLIERLASLAGELEGANSRIAKQDESLAKFGAMESQLETAQRELEALRASATTTPPQAESERIEALEKERTALLAKLEASKRSAEADMAIAQAAEARIAVMEHDLEKAMAQLEELQEAVKQSAAADKAVVVAAEAKAKMLSDEVEVLNRKLKEAEEAADLRVSMATESLQKENLAFKEQTAQFEEHVKGLFDKLQTELASQQQARAELESELDRLRHEMSQTLVEARRETATITEALQAEQEDHITTRNEMAELRRSFGDTRAKLEQLEGISQERDRHLTELEALRTENENLSRIAGSVHEKEERIELLTSEVEGLQHALDDKQRSVHRLEGWGAERESLRDELAAANARIEMLEKEAQSNAGTPSASDDLAELKSVLDHLPKDDVAPLQPALEPGIEERFGHLEQALKAAEDQLNASRGRINSVMDEIKELRREPASGPAPEGPAVALKAPLVSDEASEAEASAPLGSIGSMPTAARNSLLSAGIRMYSQLAMTPAPRVLEITGHDSFEDAESWIGEAVRLARSEGA